MIPATAPGRIGRLGQVAYGAATAGGINAAIEGTIYQNNMARTKNDVVLATAIGMGIGLIQYRLTLGNLQGTCAEPVVRLSEKAQKRRYL